MKRKRGATVSGKQRKSQDGSSSVDTSTVPPSNGEHAWVTMGSTENTVSQDTKVGDTDQSDPKDGVKFECYLCEDKPVFPSYDRMRLHFSQLHFTRDGREQLLQCPDCGDVFSGLVSVSYAW